MSKNININKEQEITSRWTKNAHRFTVLETERDYNLIFDSVAAWKIVNSYLASHTITKTELFSKINNNYRTISNWLNGYYSPSDVESVKQLAYAVEEPDYKKFLAKQDINLKMWRKNSILLDNLIDEISVGYLSYIHKRFHQCRICPYQSDYSGEAGKLLITLEELTDRGYLFAAETQKTSWSLLKELLSKIRFHSNEDNRDNYLFELTHIVKDLKQNKHEQ